MHSYGSENENASLVVTNFCQASHFMKKIKSSSDGDESELPFGLKFSEFVFMAPERVSGKTSDLETCKSSDIWSLGVLLYLLVTGRLPYEG